MCCANPEGSSVWAARFLGGNVATGRNLLPEGLGQAQPERSLDHPRAEPTALEMR